MKKIFLALVFGFLLGATVTGLLSPSMIAWYFDPPASMGISCKEAVIWGIGAYQKLFFLGGIGGLVLGILFLIFTRNKKTSTP